MRYEMMKFINLTIILFFLIRSVM